MEVKTVEYRRAQNPLEFSVVRGTKMMDNFSRSYEGIQYTNSLRVNRRIQLTGFTFFTPEKEINDTVYNVVVKTMRTEKVVANFRQYKSKAELERADNQRIRINPPLLIQIEPNVWYDVKFGIQGPPTRSLKLVEQTVVVYADNDKEKEGCAGCGHAIATFDFFIGSGQLPEYHFLLC